MSVPLEIVPEVSETLPTVSAKPPRLNVPPFTVRSLPSAMTLFAPSCRMPAETVESGEGDRAYARLGEADRSRSPRKDGRDRAGLDVVGGGTGQHTAGAGDGTRCELDGGDGVAEGADCESAAADDDRADQLIVGGVGERAVRDRGRACVIEETRCIQGQRARAVLGEVTRARHDTLERGDAGIQ